MKLTFFDECSEALQQIEAGLTEMQDGTSTDDTINAIFRSVHSVKGGAGIFGFEDLVNFAHVFETVLDTMRNGKLSATHEIMDVLLQANDVLSDLITMSRSGEAIPPNHGSECRAALERLIGIEPGGAEEEPMVDFDGLDFMPVRVDDFDATAAGDGLQTFGIVFRPKAEMLRKANEPLYIIRELRKLGELDLVAETDALPHLTEIEPDRPYVGWTGTLRTASTRAQVEEVFEFVTGDCEIEITEADPMPAFGSMADSMPADVVPQAEIPLAPVAGEASIPAPAAPHDEPMPVAKPGAPVGVPEVVSAPKAAPAAKAGSTTTRIELERIDRVVNMVGELVIAQAMLGQIVHDLPEATSGRLAQILDEVIHHTRELKDSVMSMRAQPVGSVFQRMPRLVRELSTKTSKRVRLEMSGETTEVDRSIIERLGDPLTHIIRNAVDHGIESPADRLAAGKKEEGTVHLSAEHRGGKIVIEIRDDGAGINSERVLKKARERGLVGPDATLSDEEVNNLIMAPGFSTAETISDISGRGVGMDVVRSNIQDIGGRISLKSERGRGMTITLALPLTLAVMDGMVIKVGQETYVMPLSTIVECLRPAKSEISSLVGTRGMLQLRGDLVPIMHLADLLDIGSNGGDDSEERVVIITDGGDGSRFGLVVDQLCGHQQVVIKSIEESYGSVPGIAAATILGNGRVAFILDVEKLSDLAVKSSISPALAMNSTSVTKSKMH
ncbi:MAG: chemotaxis protein CheA [Xanthobacteraceae bacterium]|nr:chemotaxis protein CheA [Xanthobacteraceae bacterium]